MLIILTSISINAQNSPPIKFRSLDSFTQQDSYLNVSKRFGIPTSATDNLNAELTSFKLIYNTTLNKLRIYDGLIWKDINFNTSNLVDISSNQTITGFKIFNVQAKFKTHISFDGGNYATFVSANPAISNLGNNIVFYSGNYNFGGSFSTSILTNNREFIVPDKNGTIALLSDIPISSTIQINSGTYTPTYSGFVNIVTNYPSTEARWIKVGKNITVNIPIDIAPIGAGTVNLNLSLPFTASKFHSYTVGSGVITGQDLTAKIFFMGMISQMNNVNEINLSFNAVSQNGHTGSLTIFYETLE